MIKVAILGAGFMGRMHASCYAKTAASGQAEIAWIIDSNLEKAAETAEKFGGRATDQLEKALNDPEVRAIDICLPTYLHREYVEKASRAGKDILCEKPIALNTVDADRMIEAAAEAGVKFMVAQVIRFWPEYQKLTEIYHGGKLGKLLSLSLKRTGTAPTWTWENWMLDPEKSGLAALDLHVHDTDYLYHLLGEPQEVISRLSGAPYGHISSIFTYPGILVTSEAGWDTPPSMMFMMGYQAIFEKGFVEFDTRLSPSFAIYRGDEVEHPEIEKFTIEESGGNISDLGGYYREIEYFVNCLAENREPEMASAASARNSLALVLREIDCARRSRGA